jgi:exodeoxyribonuclease V alpha subunit
MTGEVTRLSPAAARLLGLLDRALADGHTVLPVALAGSVLSGAGLRLEVALKELGPAGSGVVSAPTPPLLGLRRVVDAEQVIAAQVETRAAHGQLHVVVGPAGAPRDEAAARFGDAAVVADDAEYLDVETLATFFGGCSDDETVVLTGDLDGLGSPGAGRAFADIAESGLADVVRVAADPATTGPVLRDFAAAVASGELTAVDDPTRELVVVTAGSAAEAAHRVDQLVATSIPRALGIEPANIQVVTTTSTGACGPPALAARLHAAGASSALTVHDSLGRRWPAVVLVVAPESAGLLSRQLLYSGITRATRHLSIVQAAGGSFAEAVTSVPSRRRRTLLPQLLHLPAAYSSSDSHSSSSSSPSSLSSSVSTGPNGVTSSYAENSASS